MVYSGEVEQPGEDPVRYMQVPLSEVTRLVRSLKDGAGMTVNAEGASYGE